MHNPINTKPSIPNMVMGTLIKNAPPNIPNILPIKTPQDIPPRTQNMTAGSFMKKPPIQHPHTKPPPEMSVRFQTNFNIPYAKNSKFYNNKTIVVHIYMVLMTTIPVQFVSVLNMYTNIIPQEPTPLEVK